MLYLPTARLWHVNLEGKMRLLTSGEVSYVHPDVGRNGTVVASRLDLKSDVFMFPTDGTPQANTEKRESPHIPDRPSRDTHCGSWRSGSGLCLDRGGHANIWAIDVASRKLRQDHQRTRSQRRRLAFRSGPPRAVPSPMFRLLRAPNRESHGIWLVNPDGSGKRLLVSPGVGPSWLPDGKLSTTRK